MGFKVFWLAAVIALCVGEAATVGLVCIWFAAGALGAFLAACVGAPLWTQLIVFAAVSAAALTIYDMCKAVQRDMEIGPIRLCRKTGGRSGTYEKEW